MATDGSSASFAMVGDSSGRLSLDGTAMRDVHIESPTNTEDQSERRSFRSPALLATSAILCIVISSCYWLQPDWLAPVTLVPTWFWLVPALVLTGCGFSRAHKRSFAAVAVLWVVYAAVVVEESRSLVRAAGWRTSAWEAACDEGRAIRVVSLNCAGGNPLAAAEVLPWQPDLVLLQESPSREHVERLARQLFGEDGGYLWGTDTSIVARGAVRPATRPRVRMPRHGCAASHLARVQHRQHASARCSA